MALTETVNAYPPTGAREATLTTVAPVGEEVGTCVVADDRAFFTKTLAILTT